MCVVSKSSGQRHRVLPRKWRGWNALLRSGCVVAAGLRCRSICRRLCCCSRGFGAVCVGRLRRLPTLLIWRAEGVDAREAPRLRRLQRGCCRFGGRRLRGLCDGAAIEAAAAAICAGTATVAAMLAVGCCRSRDAVEGRQPPRRCPCIQSQPNEEMLECTAISR